MKRYTTPKHIFNVPFDTGNVDKLRLVYAQGETPVFVKEIADCECTGKTVTVTLTQEETAMLDCKKVFVEIQMHVLMNDGNSLVSDPVKVPVEKCLDAEVLV